MDSEVSQCWVLNSVRPVVNAPVYIGFMSEVGLQLYLLARVGYAWIKSNRANSLSFLNYLEYGNMYMYELFTIYRLIILASPTKMNTNRDIS